MFNFFSNPILKKKATIGAILIGSTALGIMIEKKEAQTYKKFFIETANQEKSMHEQCWNLMMQRPN